MEQKQETSRRDLSFGTDPEDHTPQICFKNWAGVDDSELADGRKKFKKRKTLEKKTKINSNLIALNLNQDNKKLDNQALCLFVN